MKDLLRANKGFILFLCLFGVFRTAVADWNPIPSASMRPNLLEGDVVFVNRLAFDLKIPLTDVIVARLGEPSRGDVVTFTSPQPDGTRLIKRVLALRNFDPVRIPADHYLMLGDNRDDSGDSRVIGLVPREKLIGRAERILVSADYQGNWMPRTSRFGMSLRNQGAET